MKKNKFPLFLIVVLMIPIFSCVRDTDFGQWENINLTPVVELDFIYSEFDVEDEIPENAPPDTEFEVNEPIRDTIDYDLVGSDFSIDNLDRVEFHLEIRNQIQRNFGVQFQFLTEDGQPIGQLYDIFVAAGNGKDADPVISRSVPDPLVLDRGDLRRLENAQKVYAELIIPTLNTNLTGILTLRSKGVYYVNYFP